MDMISVDYRGSVMLAKFNRGVTNALNPEFVQELGEVLQRVESDVTVRGLVLGSSNEKFFSIGLDIPDLYPLDREDFRDFLRVFNRVCMDLYTLPKPTVAAITGHALAGGCILALCCDWRFIAEGRKLMGLNEVKLGVPVPYLADRVLHALAGVRHARKMMEGGDFYAPAEALEMGMVDEVLPVEEVVNRALAHAEKLGSLPKTGYGMIKRNRVETTVTEVLARETEMERYFIESWYSEAVRERLREAMEKF
ncbi:MAG: enoyl-CoA hydratase/isomerase family protein [Deltaproteobacteria bacterium]|nr:enoyl-CoA hydratase/isomerase family protein [Deltaproteobacteria bacterium]MBW1970747.1 enoyl-CoA hydratase/isomerase family protein [Deltaproteobacteria bacterium]MBW2226739.1 enoyl-CoA hydratase/isomerase family protein [Deltaproteobacteria bacterium]